MRYKYVFWDWNGTLFNDTVLCHELTNILLDEIGVRSVSFDDYRKKLRHPIKEFYDELTGGDTSDTYPWFSEKFHDLYEERRFSCGIHNHAEDCIAFFKSYQAGQSILSAHPQYLLDSIVNHLKISHHFEHVIGASDKLATDKFKEGEKLMLLSKADPKFTLIVGDTQHDAEVADRLGIDCVIVAQGMQCKTKMTTLKVPVLDDLGSLKEFLLK